MGLGRFAESLRNEVVKRSTPQNHESAHTRWQERQRQTQEEENIYVEEDVGEGRSGGAHIQDDDDSTSRGSLDIQQ